MPEPDVPFPGDVAEHGDMKEALRAMVDRDFLKSQRWQEQQWRAVRDGLHPWLREFEPLLVKRMARLGVPLFLHCGVRSAEQQLQEFREGNSKLRDGPHVHGCAVDVVHGTKAWGLTRNQWQLIGHVGREICKARGLDLEWGGEWRRPYDPAHWQVKGWRALAGGFPQWPSI